LIEDLNVNIVNWITLRRQEEDDTNVNIIKAQMLVKGQMTQGKTIKLRETPKILSTKDTLKDVSGQGNDLVYGKNDRNWAIRSQAPKPVWLGTEKVQRLNGCRLQRID
jgi:hypothetical protein